MSRRLFWPVVAIASLSLVISVRGQAPGGRRGGQPVTLPEGAGQASVQSTCAQCHSLNLIVNSGGYTREGWEQLFSTMVALPKDQAAVLADYLAKNFSEQPRPPAVLIPGSARVSFKEWLAPTLGSRPHDPLAMPDGSLW